MKRFVSRRVVLLWSACVAASLMVVHAAPAAPELPAVPLVISADEGVAAVSLAPASVSASGLENTRRPTRRDEARTAPKLQSFVSQLLGENTGTFSSGRRTQRRVREANRFVSQLFRKVLNSQINPRRRRAPAAGGNLSVLAVASVVTAAGLTLEEDVSLDFTLNTQGYHADLTQQYQRTTEAGASLQVDYTPLPAQDAVDGSLVAAFIRESTTPTTGVLVLIALDSGLPALLETYGVANETVSERAITLPYDLSLTGSANGTLTAPSPSFDDVYYAKADVLGIAVPPTLAEQVEALVGRLGEGVE